MSEYITFMVDNWQRFINDPARARASLEAAAGIQIHAVLDVGCGAGQELLPFLNTITTFGVGIDPAPEAGHIGRELFATHLPGAKVAFVRGAAETLPFRSAQFDVVICRLALPYTDNSHALAEMARVLRPGGILLIKIHHLRYYLRKLLQGVYSRQPRSIAYAARVMITGTLYQLTGLSVRNGWMGMDTYQTVWRLRRDMDRYRLTIRCSMPDSNPYTPSFVVERLPDL